MPIKALKRKKKAMEKESEKETREWSWDNTGHRAVETNVIVRLLGGRTENFLFLDFYGDLVCGMKHSLNRFRTSGTERTHNKLPSDGLSAHKHLWFTKRHFGGQSGARGPGYCWEPDASCTQGCSRELFYFKTCPRSMLRKLTTRRKKKQLFWGLLRTFSNASY